MPRYAAGIFPRKDPGEIPVGEHLESWRDPVKIPVAILQGLFLLNKVCKKTQFSKGHFSGDLLLNEEHLLNNEVHGICQ